MSPVLIILLIVVILLAFGLFSFFLLKGDKNEKERARQIITGQMHVQTTKDKVDPRDRRRAEIVKKLKDDEDSAKKKKGTSLREKIQQAGLNISIKQYFIYSAILTVLVLGILMVIKASPVTMFFMTIVAFFGIPRYIIRRMAKRRQKKFMDELADVLEAMVRLLKAGMPVSEAILMVSREYGGPIGEEMTKIYDAQKIGVPLHEAAEEATHRMPLTEMKMFATGLAIQAQTGSSLSEILTNLAGVIRARYKLARKVKALSSEAKASAGIIGSMPIIVSLGIYFINPAHMQVLLDTSVGNFLLAGAVFWMFCGIMIMKAMINFKV